MRAIGMGGKILSFCRIGIDDIFKDLHMNGTWGWPLLLAAVTLVGLASGILGDGIWDYISWVALSVPLLVIGNKVWRQTRKA